MLVGTVPALKELPLQMIPAQYMCVRQTVRRYLLAGGHRHAESVLQGRRLQIKSVYLGNVQDHLQVLSKITNGASNGSADRHVRTIHHVDGHAFAMDVMPTKPQMIAISCNVPTMTP